MGYGFLRKVSTVCVPLLSDLPSINSFSGSNVFSVAKRLGDWNLLLISASTTFLTIKYNRLSQDLVTCDKLVSTCEY